MTTCFEVIKLPPQKKLSASRWCSATRNGHWPRIVLLPPMTNPLPKDTFPQMSLNKLPDRFVFVKWNVKNVISERMFECKLTQTFSLYPHFEDTIIAKLSKLIGSLKFSLMHWFRPKLTVFSFFKSAKAIPFICLILL